MYNAPRFICLFFIVVSLLSCTQHPKPKESTRQVIVKPVAPSQEEKVVKLIMDLKEIKSATAAVEKASKGTRTLSTYVETQPTDESPDYWIKVAEDNGVSYVTYYTFRVNAKTLKISCYDNATETMIPLEQWQKQYL